MPARRDIEELLAAKLAAGATIKAAAAELGISEKTARRRLADPAFQQQVAALRRELVAGAVGRLADRMAQAADVLGKLLESANETIRLKAATALLTHASQTALLADVQSRLTALEGKLTRASVIPPTS